MLKTPQCAHSYKQDEICLLKIKVCGNGGVLVSQRGGGFGDWNGDFSPRFS